MRRELILLVFGICCNSSVLLSQPVFFSTQDENAISKNNSYRVIIPGKYHTTFLNTAELKGFLWSLPSEQSLADGSLGDRKLAPILALPTPDGKLAKFRVWESSVMEPGLAARFPEIKTFTGQGIDDPYATVRFDYNPYFGFNAQILSINGDVLIEALARGNTSHYISYYIKDSYKRTSFHCTPFTDSADKPEAERIEASICRGPQLYTYRLALACSGEYATAVCSPAMPTVPSTLAAITTTLNRVNGIYENELAMRFLLVANNSQVLYLDGSNDPFTNGNEEAMMNECQATLNAVIGSANYDAGMVLGTGNNSAAYISGVCNSPNKGKAVCGLPDPTGDIFDVGRVAHNLGHLFGATDTHNSNDVSCTGGPNVGHEPGSGTTIMSAAGSCNNDNLQPLPDPYFHSKSFDQITGFITGSGAGCHGIINTGNNPPRFTNNVIYGNNIPMNTPFQLRGVTAIDDDGDPVTFSWEETDRGPSGSWNSALGSNAPAFRSRVPQTTSERVFPDMQLVLAGYPPNPPATQGGLKGETLSTISRTYSFTLTLRDGRGGVMNAGSNCSSTTFGEHVVYTVPGTGPFKVTLPDGGETWSAGSSQTILWNVAGTDASPINTATVNILLSTDGGYTYPFFLASNVPNDGFEVVFMPNISTTTARIKIEAVNNIFFDISNGNFSIVPAPVGFEFTNPQLVTVSCPAPASIGYTLGTISNGGYNTPVNLSATGVPAGTTITFGTNPVLPGGSSTITLNNVNTLTPGIYYITVIGASGSISRSRVLALHIQTGSAPVITMQPVSQTDCAGSTVTFSVSSPSAIAYQWQISTDGGFVFNDITPNGNLSTLTITNISSQHNTYKYRCIVIGQCNSTISNIVQVNVWGAAFITTQPQNVSACVGSSKTISVSVFSGAPAYQWQVNSGAGFSNISGATSNVLTLSNITSGMNNYQYRCLLLNPNCITPTISDTATLTVLEGPFVTLNAAPYTKLFPGLQTTITATGSGSAGSLPFSFRWILNGSYIGGATGNTYSADFTKLGSYRAEITDAKGCVGLSAVLNIGDSASNKLFIFPNPNNGEFKVTFHNPGSSLAEREVTIYNSLGEKILSHRVTISGPYQLILYNLSSVAKGIYFIVLSDGAGKILAKEKVTIQ